MMLMKSMMRKTTLREIQQSFGRYMAILAIVALGVGFFAGLKVTKPAMTATARAYLEEKNFYDYRLLSTLGFEQEDVDFFASQEGVRTAQGSVSADILYISANGNEGVIKVHTLTEGVNELELLAGNMPQRENECVVDSNLYTSAQIGEKIKISDNNSEEDLEKFKNREYTITGIVQSSYYIQFERGNSSLGNGKVNGFMYVLPNSLDLDYFTEIFIKFDQDFELYSEAYTAFLDGKEARWEELCRERADRRYRDILEEAETKLAEARAELEDKKAEAEAELEDAKTRLEDAYAELTDGKEQIEDAQKQLADAKKEIADNEQKLKEAEEELAAQEALLPEKEQELADGESRWHENNGKVNEQDKLLNEKQAQLNQQKAQLEEGSAQLDIQEAAILAGETRLNEEISSGTRQETDPDVIQERAVIQAGKDMIAGKRAEIAAGLSAIGSYQSQLDEGKNALAGARNQLKDAWEEIEEGRRQLEDGKRQIEEAKTQIAEGRQEIEQAKQDLKKAQTELAEKKTELTDGFAEYEEGLAEYEEAKEEFETQIADGEEKLADAEKEIADIDAPDTFVLGRNTNVGYVLFENDSDIVEGIANIFPVFFFLVAGLVCITTMNRMVEEQRTQIGVLKALGYSERTIMYKYMFYSGSAAVMGCIGGYFMGTFLFPRVIWNAYGIMYNMTPLVYVFSWPLAAVSLIVSVLCSVGTTWLSCRYELAEVAAELMRPKAPKAGKRVILEYVPFIWKRLKFLYKVSARNIFRYKKRFFMMVIGISGCTALLVTGFGVKDSVANVGSQQFAEIQTYDVSVTFADAVGKETDEQFGQTIAEHALQYSYVCEESIDLHVGSQMKAVEMIIAGNPDEIGDYISLHNSKDEAVLYPQKDEIVISKKLADTYHLKAGDEVRLQDEDMNGMVLRVSGICENFIYNYVYVNAESYTDQMGKEPDYKTALLNLKEGADSHQAAAEIMKMSEVSAVTVNADMEERFSSMMKSLDYIVIVIILCAAGLAFIVLYNLTNINITERIREIATIKVLGFYKKETSSYVFRENTVLTLVGTAAGLVMGYFLHQFVMHEVNIDMVSFDIHVRPVSYIYSVLLTLLFAWIVNRVMSGKLEKINMAESLKSVD